MASVEKDFIVKNGLKVSQDAEISGNLNVAGAVSFVDGLNVLGGGNIGIGLTTPTAALSIDAPNGTVGIDVLGNDSTTVFSSINRTLNVEQFSVQHQSGNVRILNRRNGSLSLGTNNLDRVTISNGGNVGIGKSNPGKKLDVEGDAIINGVVVGKGGGNSTLNTVVAFLGLHNNTTGIRNTAMGTQSLFKNTTGGSNTGLGLFSLANNEDGSFNTAVGANSLRNLVGGNTNTAIGNGALTEITTGSLNTSIGRFDGNQNGIDIRESDNNITLSDGLGNVSFWKDSGDNVKLLTDNTERIHVSSNGNVGIGTSNPTAKLDVVGDFELFGRIRGNSVSDQSVNTGSGTTAVSRFNGILPTSNIKGSSEDGNNSVFNFSCTRTGSDDAPSGVAIKLSCSSDSSSGESSKSTYLYSASDLAFGSSTYFGIATNNTERLMISSNGDVGIGTGTPTDKFHVIGTIRSSEIHVGQEGDTPSSSRRISFANNRATVGYSGSALSLSTLDDSKDIVFRIGSSERMRIDGSDGRVGIGTTAPEEKLHVNGNVKVSGSIGTTSVFSDSLIFNRTDSSDSASISTETIEGTTKTNMVFRLQDNGDDRFKFRMSPFLGTDEPNNAINVDLVDLGFKTLGEVGSKEAIADYRVSGDLGVTRRLGAGIVEPESTLDVRSGEQGIISTFYGSGAGHIQVEQKDDLTFGFNVFNSRNMTFSTNQSERMRIAPDGKIAVANIAPQSYGGNLQVTANQDNTALSVHHGAENNFNLKTKVGSNTTFSNTFTHGLFYQDIENAAVKFYRGGNTEGGFMTFTTNNGSERMRLTSEGRLGIGTGFPSYNLHVNAGDGSNTTEFVSRFTSNLSNGNSAMRFRAHNNKFTIISEESDSLVLGSNNNEVVTIANDGNVGIGTDNPTAKLHVNGSALISGDLTVNGTTTSVNSTVTTINDPVITLGDDSPSSSDSKDRGIEFKYGDGTNVKTGFFGMDRGDSRFKFIPDASNSSEDFSGSLGEIQASKFIGELVGSASKLTTARTISLSGDTSGSISFDGSHDVTIDSESTQISDSSLARQQGWVPAYSNLNPDTVVWNKAEESVEIKDTVDNSLGSAFKAVKVKAGDVIDFSVMLKGVGTGTEGLYIRLYQFDGELPNGKTHVSNDVQGAEFVQEESRHDASWVENQAVPTDWTNYYRTYTAPVDGYVSLVVLNWQGHTGSIFVKRPDIKISRLGAHLPLEGGTLTGELLLPSVRFTGADGTDSARISATRSGSSTFFDFILSDDAGSEDSWRWQFSQAGAGTHTAMRLDPQSATSSNLSISGDLTVSGGDITLGGTGRIQGVDTVSASTDATNKAYVDAATESAKASTVQVITDNKTISSTDEYKVLYFKNTSDITVTLPDASSVPTGFNFKIANAGLAKVTFTTSSGDVINNSKTTFDLFGGAELHKVSDDEYLIIE